MSFLRLSPTKAANWLDCPRKFFFAYVEKSRPRRSWAHLSFGNAVHGALRDWFDVPEDRRAPESVSQLVSRAWRDDGFRDQVQSSLWRDRAIVMVRDYVVGLNPNFSPVSTERTLAFKEDTFVVEGRIDRLDARGEALAVVDYKTGKSSPRTEDVRGSAALAMYALMAQRSLGRTCLEVSFHHLPSGTSVSWTHTPESLARQRDRMAGVAAEITRTLDTWESVEADDRIRDDLFPPNPGALCGFCDYWRWCDAGRDVAPHKESWDGLAADSTPRES